MTFHTRSSRPEVFCKNGVYENFAKFTGKHLCQSLVFNKVAHFRPATLLRDSGEGGFLWILWNFEEHLFFIEHLCWLLPVTIHAKSTILDVWQGFKYVSQSHCCYNFFVKFGGNFKCCSSFPIIDCKHICFICLRIKLASIKHDKWRWKEAHWGPNFFVFCLLVSVFVLQMLSYCKFHKKTPGSLFNKLAGL